MAEEEIFEPEPEEEVWQAKGVFVFLNKVTGQKRELVLSVDEPQEVEKLTINVTFMHKTSPEEAPENTAFVKIKDGLRSNKEVYSNWMFSSEPSVNAFEHPLYSIWLKDVVLPEPKTEQEQDEQNESNAAKNGLLYPSTEDDIENEYKSAHQEDEVEVGGE